VKEEEERKKEREKGKGSDASWRASHSECTGMTESRHVRRRDYDGLTQATWQVLCHGGA
jgi:hypothetical protein